MNRDKLFTLTRPRSERKRITSPSNAIKIRSGINSLLKLAEGLDKGKIPSGLGIKLLRHEIWEARSGVQDRSLFKRTSDDILQLLLIGTHDDIKISLKNLKVIIETGNFYETVFFSESINHAKD